jgi:hypothetical protein
MKKGSFSPKQVAAYHRDGYLIARKFFDREEVGLWIVRRLLACSEKRG